MYIATPTTTRNDRLIAGTITAFILTSMLAALQWANLPAVKQRTTSYEDINWTRFTPKPKKIVEPPAPKPVSAKQPVKLEPPPQPLTQPQPTQKIDLSALKVQFESVAKPARTLSTSQSPAEPATEAVSQSKISLKKSSLLGGLNTLLGESTPRLQVTGRGSKGRRRSGASSLKAQSGSTLSVGKGGDYGSGGQALGAPEAKDSHGSSVEISMLDLTQMDGDFADLSPIYQELIDWMKRNPENFPDVVSRFMGKVSGDLSSIVKFQMAGRQFEMFILCKENLFEVRVCLLEGNESTYLIDRGFKENSSFLRVGSVNQTPVGDILSFGTTRKAASNRRTSEFYQVFLSWWESVKK